MLKAQDVLAIFKPEESELSFKEVVSRLGCVDATLSRFVSRCQLKLKSFDGFMGTELLFERKELESTSSKSETLVRVSCYLKEADAVRLAKHAGAEPWEKVLVSLALQALAWHESPGPR